MEDSKLSPMGKINLQWADFALIAMCNAAFAFKIEKRTLFIKKKLKKMYILPRKTYISRTFFTFLRTFGVNVTRQEVTRYLPMVKMNIFLQQICLFCL